MAPLRQGPPSRFVGRTAELSRLHEALRGSERLVAVVGTAGVGKTRFVQHALGVAAVSPIAADLQSAGTVEVAVRRVAQALGIALGPTEDPVQSTARVGDAIAARGASAVVVLDGAEPFADSLGPVLGAWLAAAPRARFVVVSRRRLGPSAPDHVRIDLAPLAADDATELLVDRARRVRRDFEVKDADRTSVRALLGRLDGLPLAVEVAAARLRLLSPTQLLERFGSGSATTPLQAAIARSWELLSPEERAVLAQSSVFRDGFQIAAAEAVIVSPPAAGLLEVLEALVAHSLLRTRTLADLGGEVRIAPFLAVQEHAAARLAEDPAAELAAEARHADYYASEGERWDAGIETAKEADHTRRLVLEIGNLEAAYERSRAHPARRARLGLVLHLAYQRAGPFAAQGELVEQVVEAAEASREPELAGRARLARARVRRWSGDLAAAETDLREAARALRSAGDVSGEAGCHRNLAAVALARGDTAAAEASLREALAAARASGRPADEVNARNGLGFVLALRGDHDGAEDELQRALRLARRTETPGLVALVCASLAQVEARRGRPDEAERHAGEAIAAYEELRYLRQLAEMRLERGAFRLAADMAGAAEDATRALELARTIGLRRLEGRALELGARIALQENDAARALALSRRAIERAGESPELADLLARASAFQGRRVAPVDLRLEVAASGRAFKLGRKTVDFTRRRALRGIFEALVRQRRTHPGRPLGVDAVLEAGWPGERMSPESGARRVYVTINRMRKLGLEGVLLTMGDGYMLDPQIPISE